MELKIVSMAPMNLVAAVSEKAFFVLSPQNVDFKNMAADTLSCSVLNRLNMEENYGLLAYLVSPGTH